MLSDRLGPATSAPGSFVPGVRRSEPSTSVVCGLVRPTPPPARRAWAESGTASCWSVALIRNSTSDSTSQPTTASASHVRTRPTVIRRRRFGGSSPGGVPRSSSSSDAPSRPRCSSRGRAR
jgi:hypothetical protein